MTKTLQENTISAKDRLILSLDIPVKGSIKLISELKDVIRIVKINYLHFLEIATSSDPETRDFLPFMAERKIGVFFDLKFYDIKNTVSSYTRALSKVENIDFCTIHGNPSLMEAAIEGRNGCIKPKLLLVTLLTSLNEKDMKEIYNIEEGTVSLLNHVLQRAKQAHSCGMDGVIASGKHAGLIKEAVPDNNFVVVSPGVRLDEHHDDHKRVTTPEEAIENGSDYLVIGRPIYKADDPKRVTENIIDRMQKAFNQKIR